jgi:CheY-like chemotaxis protein
MCSTVGLSDTRTVLLVDDDALVRWSIRSTLERGFRVVEAGDATEALSVLAAVPIDLVVSDLAMDGMDGLSLIEEMRKRGHAIKTLILTAFETEEVDRRAFRLGVAGVLRKPIDLPSLYEVVRSHLENPASPPAVGENDARRH